MPASQDFFSGKRKYLFGLVLLSLTTVICAAFSMEGSDEFNISRREILLRKIGDELLLQSGDRTSRVLPIKKIAENEYQISFENKLTFQPGSLVNITRQVFSKDPLTISFGQPAAFSIYRFYFFKSRKVAENFT